MAKKKEEDKKSPEEEVEKKPSKETIKNENKILRNILIFISIILILSVAFYLYELSGSNAVYTYKNIQFSPQKIGNVQFYDTITLANNTKGVPFGFRIRTNPNELKKVPFQDLQNFQLMKVNGFKLDNGTFKCNGDGVISMVNIERTFNEIGATWVMDQNATCDPQGRYNFFIFKYGNKTQVKSLGNNCYDVVIKGNDTNCEILPATEKIMVEAYSKYLNLTK